MTDLHAGMILAAIQIIVMLGGMRTFYGCWPWEYHKTWYATKPTVQAVLRSNTALAMALNDLKPQPAAVAPEHQTQETPPLTVLQQWGPALVHTQDTFIRPEEPLGSVTMPEENPPPPLVSGH